MIRTRHAACSALIALVGLIVGAVPAAADERPPNCTVADLAGVMTGVAAATSAYLFTHPDANAFFTGLKSRPRDEMRGAVEEYIGAHPDVGDALRAIRAPAVEFRTRCGLPTPLIAD
jgi:hemophore-related protein